MRDTSHHDRRLARRLEDPGFRAEYERKRREIDRIEKEERLWRKFFNDSEKWSSISEPDIGDEPFIQ